MIKLETVASLMMKAPIEYIDFPEFDRFEKIFLSEVREAKESPSFLVRLFEARIISALLRNEIEGDPDCVLMIRPYRPMGNAIAESGKNRRIDVRGKFGVEIKVRSKEGMTLMDSMTIHPEDMRFFQGNLERSTQFAECIKLVFSQRETMNLEKMRSQLCMAFLIFSQYQDREVDEKYHEDDDLPYALRGANLRVVQGPTQLGHGPSPEKLVRKIRAQRDFQ